MEQSAGARTQRADNTETSSSSGPPHVLSPADSATHGTPNPEKNLQSEPRANSAGDSGASGGEKPARPPLADILHNRVTAWAILLLSLVVTVIAWRLSSTFAQERAQDRFEFHAENAQFAIQQRLSTYEQILRGGIALFEAAGNVDRSEWRRYVEGLELEKNYPGIQGIGYAKWIKPEELDAFVQQVRAEGFPSFTLHPEGAREEYTSILYLEPFTARNRRAFGFDMYSEPTRRAAMMRARDTGEAAVSGKVTLVQETNQDVQNGFLMYLPLYAGVAASVEARRAQLLGFVYSPFRMRDLMQGILGRASPAIEFTIYDGKQTNEDNLLYRSDADAMGSDRTGAMFAAAPRFTQFATLDMGGHIWTIHYRSSPSFDINNSSNQPLLVAVGGITIDLLLFYIIVSLSRLRQRALALAQERLAQLRAREVQFKAITDSAHDGILAVDDAGRIAYVNPAGQTLFGASDAELVGRPLTDLIGSQYATRLQELLNKRKSTDKVAPWEVEALRRDGEVFPAELSLAHWCAEGVCSTTAVIRDITDRKKIERLQNEFVSTVSHELRTPLTAIRGSLGLIGGAFRDGLDVRRRQLVAIAASNVERLSKLINDILDTERMGPGAPSLTLQNHSIQTLIDQSLEDNSYIAAQAQVTLVQDAKDTAVVRVDADRFIQVVNNLLSNAIKFSPPHGVVRINVKASGHYVRVEVHDQGPGIPDTFRPRLFQKFAQADTPGARHKGGTGLGLNISKTIIERFGGRIDYESSPQTGTTFYFEVPVVAASIQSTDTDVG